MNLRHRLQLGSMLLVALTGCSSTADTTAPSTSAPSASSEPSPTSTIQDVMELEPEDPLGPGTYFVDPDLDPETPLRVMYEVPAEGWSQWIGTVKFADPATVCSSDGCPGRPSGDAFYGYAGPGYREEFWILDVEGTRLMIASGRSPGSPPQDLAEQSAIVDSIRIDPQG